MVDTRRASIFWNTLKLVTEYQGNYKCGEIPFQLTLDEELEVLNELMALGFDSHQVSSQVSENFTLLEVFGPFVPTSDSSYGAVLNALEMVLRGKKRIKINAKSAPLVFDYLFSHKISTQLQMDVEESTCVISF